MNIAPLGDSALLVDFGDESSDSPELLRRALSAADAIDRAKIPGIVEITSAFESVALFLGSSARDDQSLAEKIRHVISSAEQMAPARHRRIEIPVCYEQPFALDAGRVENETRLSFSKIAEIHSSTDFTAACLGFLPGFAYLTGLPADLSVPRLPTPRPRVPAGSVAIANSQSGIYPFDSPGGWNIIGRTPLRLFDPNENPPTLISAGDRVRFRSITRAEFEAARIC